MRKIDESFQYVQSWRKFTEKPENSIPTQRIRTVTVYFRRFSLKKAETSYNRGEILLDTVLSIACH